MTGRHRASPRGASVGRGRHRAHSPRTLRARRGVGAVAMLGGIAVIVAASVVGVGPFVIEAMNGSRQAVGPAAGPTAPAEADRRAGQTTPASGEAQVQEASPSPSVAPPTRNPVRLRATPAIPERGPGTFRIAAQTVSERETVGAGESVTYTVEIEHGVPFDQAAVARSVDRTLADPRGWTANGGEAVRRVTGRADFRIVVATPATTDALCAPLDTGGRLSCRNGNLVVLNAWRWANGADAYRSVAQYRRYLVNHEFGHALGNSHRDCDEPGGLASVMVQQTKGLQGCRANPWPFP